MCKVCDICGGAGTVMEMRNNFPRMEICPKCEGKKELKLTPDGQLPIPKWMSLKNGDIGSQDECAENIETKKTIVYSDELLG